MSFSSFFTSESVSEGHPDKICDQLSDAVLDACLKHDPSSRVACECFASKGMLLIGGEIHTECSVDLRRLAYGLMSKIGYQRQVENMAIVNVIQEQSADIAEVVFDKQGQYGAGDQGMMFGYACRETAELMPLPIVLAHRLMERAVKLRHEGILPLLEPDAKSQVTVEYENGQPKRVSDVVLSHQHHQEFDLEDLRAELQRQVIEPVLQQYGFDGGKTAYHINPGVRFVIGGLAADTGLTGRKIMVDTYGGMGRHGGGAFSGKDPSKVDRSAAYMARYVAKNIVAAELADRCEVQLCYFIGGKKPVSVRIDCFGGERCPLDRLQRAVSQVFDLSPMGIVKTLDLRRPIYEETATYGHFGRSQFSWEKCDQVAQLRSLV